MRSLFVLVLLAACQSDAVLDLTIRPPAGETLSSVDITVCDAQGVDGVRGRLTITAAATDALTLEADGSLVRIGAFAAPDLCGVTCPQRLDSGAVIEGDLQLVHCFPIGTRPAGCPDGAASADEMCARADCFVNVDIDPSLCAD